MTASPSPTDADGYPGQSLGLPREGRGSLAGWPIRFGSLLLDWGASMIVAVVIFSPAVLTGDDWRQFMIIAVFGLETTVLTATTGGSFGQLITRLAVVRLDRRPVGLPRAVLRQVLLCAALPALIIGADRRAVPDIAAGTVVINRR